MASAGLQSLVHNAKHSLYVPGPCDLLADPLLSGPFSGNAYGMTLTENSPAINTGTPDGAPSVDFDGHERIDLPDRGAYEYGSGAR